MAQHLDGLKILAKLEDLDAYSHKAALQFPKYERHVLSAEIRSTLDRLLHLTIMAAKRYHKKATLQELDIEVEYLRALVRKAWRLRYITEHRYEVWSRHINEIGRMVGGWIKTVQGSGR